MLIVFCVALAAVAPPPALIEELTSLDRAARHTGSRSMALRADALYEQVLALPLDSGLRARVLLSHADLLRRLMRPRRAVEHYREILALPVEESLLAAARTDLSFVANDLVPDRKLEPPPSGKISLGYSRPHGARRIFCCVAPLTLTEDEALAVEILRDVGDDRLALLWAAHGASEAVPLLRATKTRWMKSESTLPALALLDLLWIRGDETLAAELDEIGPWGTAIHEPGVVQHVERLRQLRASTPPLIVSADGVAATTARWLLLLDTGRDHELGSEVVRVQSDPVLAASAPVVWTLAHLHHPLPEPLGPDLHGIAHARVFFWTEREKSAGVHDGLRRVLSEGGERLDTCWKSALGRDPALREDRRDSIKLTVSQRSRVLENVVIEGTFAAPELEGCLRKAIEGKAVDAGDDGGDLTVTVRYEMGFRDFRPFEAQRIFANP